MKFLKKIWSLIKDKKARVNLDKELLGDSNILKENYETPSMKIAKRYVGKTSNPHREIKNYKDVVKFFHDIGELPEKLKKKIIRELDEYIVKAHYEERKLGYKKV